MLVITTGAVRIKKYRFRPIAGIFFRSTVCFGGLYPKDLALQSGAAAVGGDIDRLTAPFPVIFTPTGFQVKISGDGIGHE